MDKSSYIMSLIFGYKISNALFIAAENKLFDYLDGKRSVNEIAAQTNTETKALAILLNLFASLELLTCSDGAYDIKEEYRPLLASESGSSYIPLLKMESRLSEQYANKNVLGSRLIRGANDITYKAGAKENQELIYGQTMDNGSRLSSVYVARETRHLNGTVLDLGGGIGTYAIQMCKFNQNIAVHIYDRDEMRAACEENIRRNKLEGRIQFIAADVRTCDFKSVYCGALLSNLLHLLNETEMDDLYGKLTACLQPHGLVVLHDFFLNQDKTGPEVPVLLTLDWCMLGTFFQMNTGDVRNMAGRHGLTIVKEQSYASLPTSLIVLRKSPHSGEQRYD